jgi:hypothetical protein
MPLQRALWTTYGGWKYPSPPQLTALLFTLSLKRWQPMYTVSSSLRGALDTHTTGFILKAYGNEGKALRRDPRVGSFTILFYKRYLSKPH